MTRALIATAALIAGACVALAVFTLANAIADHSWIVAGMMVGVVGGFIVAIAPRGAPRPSSLRSPGPVYACPPMRVTVDYRGVR